MEQLLAPLTAAFAVMALSLSGVLFSSRLLSAWMKRNLSYLATFSGGVFLIVVYHLLEETLHESESMALAAGAILFGAALMEALHHLFPAEHHHHEVHEHTHTQIDGRRVLLSDALHNVGDGILLVAAFSVSWSIGTVAAIGIIVHELVQEISEFFVLREAGYTMKQALVRNFASSSTILIGVAFATFLSSAEGIAILFGGLAAGGFLAVVLRDLLPNAIRSIKEHGGAAKHATALILGVALMLSIQTYFSHEDIEEAHDGEITSSPQTQDTLN